MRVPFYGHFRNLPVRALFVHIVAARKAQTPAVMMGEIISQSAATAIIIYSVIAPGSAGALELPCYKVKVEYAVKSPVYSAYNAQNIGNKVDYYHIFFSLQISMRVCRGLYARTRKGKIY